MADRKPQLSLRTILLLMACAGVLLALARPWPHLVIFFTSLATTAAMTWLLVRCRRRRWALLLPCLASWLLLYVLSEGPFVGLVTYIGRPWQPSYIATMGKVYRPLDRVLPEDGVPTEQLRWYLDKWDFSQRR